MAATVEELKELALLAREQGDDDLETKALEMLIAQQQPTESNIQPQAQNEPAAQPVAQSEQATFEDQMMSIPGMKPLAELAAASNKSIFQALDFFGPDNINAVLKAFGSSQQVPTLAETLGSDGGFMEPGLARDAVQASGMLLPVAASMAPAVGRNLASVSGITKEALGVGSASPAVSGARLVSEGNAAGIPVLTTDAIPPRTFPGKIAQQTAEKIPFAGTAPVRQVQQQMRQKAVQDVADKYGEFSYDAIVNSLKTNKNRIKSAAGNVLDKTGQQLDDLGQIPTTSTEKAIALASAEFQKPGVIQSSNAMEDLQTLVDALATPQTFTSLKENGTAFREIIKSTDKADRSQLTSRAKTLMERVQVGIREDMTSFAKTNLSQKEFGSWQKANNVYAEQAQNLTKTKLKGILDKGDITPESVGTMLFSRNPSEQKLLYTSLTKEGRDNARSAIISKVVNDLTKRQSGFTPNSFASELKKYDSQLSTFFKGDQKRQLEGLRRVLDTTRRAQDAAVTTPTGQQLIGGLSVTGLYLDPVAALGTAGTLGGLSRIYESAPVRNALLKLGSSPKSSDTYIPALFAAQIALSDAVRRGAEKEAAKQQHQK